MLNHHWVSNNEPHNGKLNDVAWMLTVDLDERGDSTDKKEWKNT